MSEKWSKEFDSCFQVGSIEEIADALEKRSGSVTNGAIVIHTQRLKSDPGGNLLS
ncbi:transposase [Escherichia coli]|nr:transposase [Escherichia coli]STK42424.1 transposase [Escherichia coli]